jgi:hypothetical protein
MVFSTTTSWLKPVGVNVTGSMVAARTTGKENKQRPSDTAARTEPVCKIDPGFSEVFRAAGENLGVGILQVCYGNGSGMSAQSLVKRTL